MVDPVKDVNKYVLETRTVFSQDFSDSNDDNLWDSEPTNNDSDTFIKSNENNLLIITRSQDINRVIVDTVSSAEVPPIDSSGGAVGSGINLADDLVSLISTFDKSNIPAEMAKGLEELAALVKDPDAFAKALNSFADTWMEKNNVAEITQAEVKDVVTSFLGENFGINVVNLAKMVGGMAILSVASQIIMTTAAEVLPGMIKEGAQIGKDFYKNLFKGDILGSAKNIVIDLPIFFGKKIIQNGAVMLKNTYKVVKGIVTPVVNGIIDSASAVTGGLVNGGKKIVNGIVGFGKSLAKGNIVKAAGSLIGGVAQGVGSAVGGVVKGVGKAIKGVGKAIGKIFKGW